MKKFKPDNYYVSFRNKTYHMPIKIVRQIIDDYMGSFNMFLSNVLLILIGMICNHIIEIAINNGFFSHLL
jgi:hypothetical protein